MLDRQRFRDRRATAVSASSTIVSFDANRLIVTGAFRSIVPVLATATETLAPLALAPPTTAVGSVAVIVGVMTGTSSPPPPPPLTPFNRIASACPLGTAFVERVIAMSTFPSPLKSAKLAASLGLKLTAPVFARRRERPVSVAGEDLEIAAGRHEKVKLSIAGKVGGADAPREGNSGVIDGRIERTVAVGEEDAVVRRIGTERRW